MGGLSTIVVIGCDAGLILKQAAQCLKSTFEKAGFVKYDGLALEYAPIPAMLGEVVD
ncbi:Putative uncharacterized protein [Halomonas sp. R57-5]|nr:Putative uncharacterized protein [Halomonas sp. R57-5]